MSRHCGSSSGQLYGHFWTERVGLMFRESFSGFHDASAPNLGVLLQDATTIPGTSTTTITPTLSHFSTASSTTTNGITTANGGGPQRSTRGASKQRRDQINVEIQKLRDLLPLSDQVKDRLFQLQVMSLGCIFIRKHRYQQTINQPLQQLSPIPRGIDICKALRGFMLMMTRGGKILHVSDNASEYLGHSVEEIMCQGDSIYDLVDVRDHGAIQGELSSGPPSAANFPEERVFICRLNLARTAKRQLQYHKFVLLQGRYIHPAEYYQSITAQTSHPEADQPVFSAFCQPLINPENAESMANGNTNIFSTQHYLDMKFKAVDSMAAHHFGMAKEKLKGKSWYEMIHPNHVPEIAYKHRLLCQEKEGSVLALIRVQSSNNEWIWLHTVFSVRPSNDVSADGKRVRHIIHCFHQKLSALEAATLQANAWIYSMRHTYPTVFSCDAPDERPLTPPSPLEQKPFRMDYNQIKVEIPAPPRATVQPSLFTPESSSPESSASSMFLNSFQPSHVEILEDILSVNDVLPELKNDDVDEILRQVEQEDIRPPRNVNLQHRHSMPSAFDPQTAELYKYLGPALFDNSTSNPREYFFQNNQSNNNNNFHQHYYNQQIIHNNNLQSNPPMSCPPADASANQSHFMFPHHQYNMDYHYNRKRSWAV